MYQGGSLDWLILAANISGMGRTVRPQVALYLDPDKLEQLRALSRDTGRTQQELLREAIDELLSRRRASAKAPRKPK